MGEFQLPLSKLLFCGIILSSDHCLDDLLPEMEKTFGPVDDVSQVKVFDIFSPFYKKEMGAELQRCFVTFQDPFDAKDLAPYKTTANAIEKKIFQRKHSNGRGVNIDPGYIGLANVIIASTKDASYRVYLKDGIYAQPMLRYIDGSFRPLEWTYQDYRDETFVSFFNDVRDKYKENLKKKS